MSAGNDDCSTWERIRKAALHSAHQQKELAPTRHLRTDNSARMVLSSGCGWKVSREKRMPPHYRQMPRANDKAPQTQTRLETRATYQEESNGYRRRGPPA